MLWICSTLRTDRLVFRRLLFYNLFGVAKPYRYNTAGLLNKWVHYQVPYRGTQVATVAALKKRKFFLTLTRLVRSLYLPCMCVIFSRGKYRWKHLCLIDWLTFCLSAVKRFLFAVYLKYQPFLLFKLPFYFLFLFC